MTTTLEHIAQHDVEPEEVEEIVYEDCHPSWVVRGRRRGVRELRWTLFGQTCAGRYLAVVIAPYSRRGVWRAVTARTWSGRLDGGISGGAKGNSQTAAGPSRRGPRVGPTR